MDYSQWNRYRIIHCTPDVFRYRPLKFSVITMESRVDPKKLTILPNIIPVFNKKYHTTSPLPYKLHTVHFAFWPKCLSATGKTPDSASWLFQKCIFFLSLAVSKKSAYPYLPSEQEKGWSTKVDMHPQFGEWKMNETLLHCVRQKRLESARDQDIVEREKDRGMKNVKICGLICGDKKCRWMASV